MQWSCGMQDEIAAVSSLASAFQAACNTSSLPRLCHLLPMQLTAGLSTPLESAYPTAGPEGDQAAEPPVQLSGTVLQPNVSVSLTQLHRMKVLECMLTARLLHGGAEHEDDRFCSGVLSIEQSRSLVPLLHVDPMVRYLSPYTRSSSPLFTLRVETGPIVRCIPWCAQKLLCANNVNMHVCCRLTKRHLSEYGSQGFLRSQIPLCCLLPLRSTHPMRNAQRQSHQTARSSCLRSSHLPRRFQKCMRRVCHPLAVSHSCPSVSPPKCPLQLTLSSGLSRVPPTQRVGHKRNNTASSGTCQGHC